MTAPLITLAGILWFAASADGERAEPYLQLWGFDEVVGPFDYHPATNRMVTGHGRRVVLWDLSTGLAVRDFAAAGAPAVVSFTGDGQSILVAAAGGFLPGGGLTIFDVTTGAARCRLPAPPSQIHDAAISPDGRYVAAGCYHHTVSIWNARTGDLLHRRKEHNGHVNFVRFSPGGERLVTGGYGAMAILWDVPSGEVLRRFPLPVELAWCEFSPDGKRLITLGAGMYPDRPRILIWDIETRQPTHVLRRSARAAWFADAGIVVLEHSGQLTFLELENGEEAVGTAVGRALLPVASLTGKSARPTVLATGKSARPTMGRPRTEVPGGPLAKGRILLAKNGWQLRIPEKDGPAVLAAPDGDWQPLSVPPCGAMSLRPLDVSLDGRRVLTAFRGRGPGNMPQGVAVWELDPPRLVRTFEAELGRFHPDGRRILVGAGRSLTLYDRETFKALSTFQIEVGYFESAQFLDDGRRLVSAGGDWYDGNEGNILLWDTETGKPIRSLTGSTQAAYYAALDHEQNLLAVTFTRVEGGNVDYALILDARSGRELQRVEREKQRLDGFVLGPQGKRVAAHDGRRTSVWEPRSWKWAYEVPGVAGSFNLDGSLLATHSDGGGSHLWSAENGSHLRSYATEVSRPSPAVFHPGGATLLLGGERDLQVWDLRENRPIAKLAAFSDAGGWLALTSAGHMAGTKAAWERITWRDADDPLEVQRDPHRVAEMSNPAAVGGVLTRSLAAGESLVKLLTEGIPVDSSPPFDPREARESPPPPDPWAQDRADEARAVELVRGAGAELRFDHDRQLTFVKLEGRSVAGPVLQAIPALRHVDRLYLADTGIRDEHLGGLGLMMQVKRLSLWGNPITDRGLLELACMWRLEALDVHDTAVTEASLECLRQIETLRTLIVPGGVDAERLRSAMGRPDLEIIPRGRPTSSPIRPLSGESASRREDAGRYGTVRCWSPGFSVSSAS